MAYDGISSLFHKNRFPRGWNLVLLLLYLPFGFALALLRLLIFVQACLVASALSEFPFVKSYVMLCICQVLGIIVHEEEIGNKNSQARIFVSNHVTRYDQIPLHIATGCVTPHAWDLPSCLDWVLGVKDLCLKQGRDMLISAVRGHLSKDPRPVLFHPEGATTSGSCGLLRFSTWPFSIISSVQPVTLAVRRPTFANVAPSVVGSGSVGDFVWFLCVPYTVYTIKYLPLMQREADENNNQFSSRVCDAVAKHLGIICTNHTSADKVEFEKKYAVNHGAALKQPTCTDPMILSMADQVAEVLLDVPLDVILKDVGRTNSVDTTIANILDGVVPYTPLQTPRTTATGPQTIPVKRSVQSSCFPKSAHDRMMSFQLRKAILIANAREKYIEKHNLKMADVDFAC